MLSVAVLQYIVIPTRRSSAEAVQILLSHALGDAGSPYLVGLVCHLLIFSHTHLHSNILHIFSLNLSACLF